MALTVLGSYFALGAMGFPVFAMTAGALPGLAYFAGPTGGYLAGFVLAVMVTGYGFVYIKQHARGFAALAMLCALMLAGHAVILSAGMFWLAFGLPQMGVAAALAAGVVPFLIGTVIKSGIAASLTGWALTR
jgi:biotin transport system substrate-specific component